MSTQIVCNKCNQSFATQGSISKHSFSSKIHPIPDGLIRCQKCFDDIKLEDGGEHAKTHKKSFFGICQDCEKQFFCEKSFKRHKEITHLGTKQAPSQTCELCNRTFRNLVSAELHITTKQCQKKLVLPCDKCGTIFYSKSRLNMHKKIKCASTSKYQCQKCGKSFQYKTNFNRHTKNVHEENMFECDTCLKAFGILGNLRKHLTAKHGIKDQQLRFQCKKCSLGFKHRRAMESHEINDHEENEIVANEDTIEENPIAHEDISNNDLDNQIEDEIGNNEEQMETEETPDTAQQIEVQKPLRKVGRKRFPKCEICEKKFSKQRFLTLHIKNPSFKTHYNCDTCKEEFQIPCALSLHINKSHQLIFK